ncbi:MAG TPA: aconitate hydratase, partial [Pseudohongiella sp.]|nr:aconitate hydratase [Pseudohongiella sp.]
IGNSGPLPPEIDEAIDKGKLTVCSVLSGNRNFEGRIHPKVRANWLASPPLVVAFALAGTTEIDLTTEALGEDKAGNPVYLRDIWPDTDAIKKAVALVSREMFTKDYADVFTGNQAWNAMPITEGDTS